MPKSMGSPYVEFESDTATSTEPPWNVVVLNDPVNLMSYVVLVFRRVLGFDEDKARKHMMEVHEQGRSIVWAGERETAEGYVHELHKWQLNALMERDA
ncbi:MAG: ATP-dependent Clp protease adapter ClpS [Puniceicoccales bacterium]